MHQVAVNDLSPRARARGLRTVLAVWFLMNAGFFLIIPLLSVHYVDRLGWAAAFIGLVLACLLYTSHTRLQATSLGWEVVDLGGVNGTWLNEHRLRPEEPTPLTVGSVLRIGPYEMILQGPEAPLMPEDKGTPISAPITPGLPAGTTLARVSSSPGLMQSSPPGTPVAEQTTPAPSRPPAPRCV